MTWLALSGSWLLAVAAFVLVVYALHRLITQLALVNDNMTILSEQHQHEREFLYRALIAASTPNTAKSFVAMENASRIDPNVAMINRNRQIADEERELEKLYQAGVQPVGA